MANKDILLLKDGEPKRRSGTDRRAANRPDQQQAIETTEGFAARIGAPAPAAQNPDGLARPRVALSAISVPKKQMSINALRAALRFADALIVTAIIMATIWGSYIGLNGKDIIAPVVAGVTGAFAFIGALFFVDAHRFAPTETLGAHIKTVLTASAAALGVWLSAALITRPDTFSPDALAIAGGLATLALIVLHTLYHSQAKRLHNAGQLIPTIVMLGATEAARRLIEENAKTRELNILAIFDDRLSRAPHNIHGVPVVGKIEDLLGWDALPYVHRIVVTLPSMAAKRKEAFVAQVRLLPNRIAFVVDEFETLDHVQQRLTQIARVGMADVTGKPKSGRHTLMKRLMDVSVSGTLLILGAPFLAILALLIKLDSPGPVLFKQPRHGFNNRVFHVYKFRSMRTDAADLQAAQQTVAGDTRVTKLGRIIRKTSLDELPQLINVLKGEMSLVGPRPHAVGMRTNDVESYKLVEEYAHRHKVKPGMTGWAQINGSRGPLHNAEDVTRRVSLDVEYIERASVLWDVVIMLKTIPCLLGDSENIR